MLSYVPQKKNCGIIVLIYFGLWNVIHGKAAASTLKSLDVVYYPDLRFITGDPYSTHHCILNQKVSWPSLVVARDQHWFLFIYKLLMQLLPPYISSLLTLNSQNLGNCSQTWIWCHFFFYSAPYTWNNLQNALHLDSAATTLFKGLILDLVLTDCKC